MSETDDSHHTENDTEKTDHQAEAAEGDDPMDPPRETTPGRGQGQGSWLEDHVAEMLEEWGYRTETRQRLLKLEADVIARREESQNDPDDFLVIQCKDWERNPIEKEVIIRLCLLAFIGGAMPVLCHTSRLTEQAWELAQAYDVRLLTLDDLEKDQLPPLTERRPPAGTTPHRKEDFASEFRSRPPLLLCRGPAREYDIEGAVFGYSKSPLCYVPDRTGHDEYVSAFESDYEFHDELP